MRIVGLIHKEGNAYGISFPDLPGCVSAADNLDALFANAEEALALHIEGMLESGEALPTPRSLDALRADPDVSEDFATAALTTVLPFDPPGKAVRINITLEENLLARLDATVSRDGGSRSGYIAAAVRSRLAG